LYLHTVLIIILDGQIKHIGDYESISGIFDASIVSSIVHTEVKAPEEKRKLTNENEDAEIDYLIEVEHLRADRQSMSLFMKYVQAFNLPLYCVYLLFLCVFSTGAVAISNIYIAQWVSESGREGSLGKLGTYAIFGFSSSKLKKLCIFDTAQILAIFIGTAYAIQTYGSYNAAQKLHDRTVHSILRAPMSFFDKTPIGRILNRLSSDIERVDTGISHLYAFLFILISEVVQCLLAMFIAIPWLIIVVTPLFVAFVLSVVSFPRCHNCNFLL
jgi:ATP-binding cassette subfamily C (CFTR/MRP) protein 1